MVSLGFTGKESTCNAGDLGSIPRLGRSPGEGKDYPFQYSGLENSTDRIVHGVAKSQTQLSDFHFCNSTEGRQAPQEGIHAPQSRYLKSSWCYFYYTFSPLPFDNLICI